MKSWIKKHGPAVVALGGALGAFVSALGLGDTEIWISGHVQAVGTLTAFIGAVAHAYVQGATGSGS